MQKSRTHLYTSSTQSVEESGVTSVGREAMWRLLMEAIVFGAVCLLFAGSTALAEIIVAAFAGLLAAILHARLMHCSAFRFTGKPQPLHILKLAAKGALRDVPQGAWHVLASLWRGRFGKQVMEPAPVLTSGTDVHAIPKRRALAILATSFGPLAYTIEAHRQALRVHRAEGTTRAQ